MTILFIILSIIGLLFAGLTGVTRYRINSNTWKLLAFFLIAVFPVLYVLGVATERMDTMKSVKFCGGCHVMTPYVTSLSVEDDEPLSSVHFRNNYVPQETACYSCHTGYAMFGEIEAKIRGLRHVWAYVSNSYGDTLALYEPYENEDCLACHRTAQRFKVNKYHVKQKDFFLVVQSGDLSCMASGCHDVAHYFEDEE